MRITPDDICLADEEGCSLDLSCRLLAAAAFFSGWLGRRFGIDPRLAMIALLLGASGVLSGIIELQRRKLRHRLEQMPMESQEALEQLDPEAKYALASVASQGGLSTRAAIWIGSMWVSWAALPWIAAPLAVFRSIADQRNYWIEGTLVLIGFVCAWAWWSINVTLWRNWAARRGVDAGELQWRGENASILWPKGHFLEGTELGNIIARASPPR